MNLPKRHIRFRQLNLSSIQEEDIHKPNMRIISPAINQQPYVFLSSQISLNKQYNIKRNYILIHVKCSIQMSV